MTITAPPTITPSSLPNPVLNAAYSQTLILNNPAQSPAPIWTTDGTLPPGLSLAGNGNSAVLAGTPTTPGTYGFTVRVTQGSESTSQVYRLTVGGPGLRFLNAATNTSDSNLSFGIAGLSFPNEAYGSLSSGQNFPPAGGSFPYTMTNGGGTAWPGASTFLASGDQNISVALGDSDSTRKVSTIFFLPGVPSSVNGGLAFMNGLPNTEVDVDLIDSTGSVAGHQGSLNYGGYVAFSGVPGQYHLRVTQTGTSTVLSSSPTISIGAGQNFFDVVVEKGSAAAWVQVEEE
ncbi:MAG TPA: Ig domain-containing protein [Fimbriimonas sp.]|nr:Ig domain-containing protein [Fimbriimonas sp.]